MSKLSDYRRVVFEIAAYRVDQDAWWEEFQRDRSARIEWLKSTDPSGLIKPDAWEERVDRWMRPSPWRYNEIVGWIQVVWDGPGPMVKAYLSPVTSRSSGDMPRRRYQKGFNPYPFAEGNPIHKLFEEHLLGGDTNEAFTARLRSSLLDATKQGGYLHRRYVDLECFDSIAPYVDWHAALAP